MKTTRTAQETKAGMGCQQSNLIPCDAGNVDPRVARRDVAAENHQAALNARLSPTDPVWTFASSVAAAMEGSILLPEKREKLLRAAERMGVQRFEAGMVVAFIQERARRGDIATLNDGVLTMLSPQAHSAGGCGRRSAWLLWMAAGLLAALLATIMLMLIELE